MPKIRLTQVAVDRVRPPAAGRVELFDRHLPGFALRVSASGHKSWVVFYRSGGKLRRHTLGTLSELPRVDDARDRAREALRAVAKGVDPAEARDAEPPADVRALASRFIEEHAKPRNRSWRDTDGLLRHHVLPHIGDRAVTDVERKDVIALLAEVRKVAPVGVNRTFAALRRMFGWAVENGIVDATPVDHVRAPAKETVRDRALTDAELATVWDAAEAVGGAGGAFVRLLILTGARRAETASMRWRDVNLSDATWTVPKEDSKSGKAKAIPLSPLAVRVLAELPRDGAYAFSTDGGTTHIAAYSKLKAKIDAIAPIEPWTLHDLRRTAATGLTRLKTSIELTGLILGHKPAGVTARVYDTYQYMDEKRAALAKWSAHVEALTGGNIVTLRSAV